jgi:hypothetical protein
MLSLTSRGIEFDLIVGALVFVVYATFLCILCLVGALICHLIGRRRLAARISHGARLVLLINGALTIWTVGLGNTGRFAGIVPPARMPVRLIGIVLVWSIGTLLWLALTMRGWRWLAPRSKARYQRALARYALEPAPLDTEGL